MGTARFVLVAYYEYAEASAMLVGILKQMYLLRYFETNEIPITNNNKHIKRQSTARCFCMKENFEISTSKTAKNMVKFVWQNKE